MHRIAKQLRTWLLTTCCLLVVGAWPVWARATPDQEEPSAEAPASHVVRSPDETIEISVWAEGRLTYSVRIDGVPVVGRSQLGLLLRPGTTLGRNVQVVHARHQSHDTTWQNPFGKRRSVRDRHDRLHLLLREQSAEGRKFEVEFRVSNDGAAFRYKVLSQPGMRSFVLDEELSEFGFVEDFECWAAGQGERFMPSRLSGLKAHAAVDLPLLVHTPAAWVAIAEAELLDWSAMWLLGTEAREVSEKDSDDSSRPAPPRPPILKAKLTPRRDGQGTIASQTPGLSPWRVLLVGRDPGRLVESEWMRSLAADSALADTTWIEPGRISSAPQLTDDAPANRNTLQEHIRLAADLGWPYQLVGPGWYGAVGTPDADITTADRLDVRELSEFAIERGVRLWLWLDWNDLARDAAFERALPLYHEWGIAGVIIDHLEGDDQQTVRQCVEVLREAARQRLMVSLRGALRPSGLDRTWPNLIASDAARHELSMRGERRTAEDKVTHLFTRGLLGRSDLGRVAVYGADDYNTPEAAPAGTRAAELALLIVNDNTALRAHDFLDRYYNQPGEEVLRLLPSTWSDTRVLQGRVGEYLVIARRAEGEWFLAALAGRDAREVEVELGFLAQGRWNARLWKDGAQAQQNAEHLATEERAVRADDRIKLRLAPAGGAVARFYQE